MTQAHYLHLYAQYLFTAFCAKQPGDATLKVGQLNGMLDELVGKNKLEEKAEVLRSLMRITSALQMRYIVSLILGDLKASLVSLMGQQLLQAHGICTCMCEAGMISLHAWSAFTLHANCCMSRLVCLD